MKRLFLTTMLLVSVALAYAVASTKPWNSDMRNQVVCVVGDFNDWQLPNQESDNGAVILAGSQGVNVSSYKGSMYLPQGDTAFALYRLDDTTYEPLAVSVALTPSFELTDESGPADYPAEYMEYCANNAADPLQYQPETYIESNGMTLYSNTERDPDLMQPFVIRNWPGGEIDISTGNDNRMQLRSDCAQAYQPVSDRNIYAIIQIDGTPVQLAEILYLRSLHFHTYYGGYAKKLSIIFSTEKSLDPAPENRYGAPRPFYSYSSIFAPAGQTTGMVKGGYPYVFEFEELVSFSIHADWISGRVTLTRHDNTLSDEYEIITFSDGVTNVEYTRVDPSTGFLPPIEVEGKEVSVSVKNPGTKPEYPLLYERYYGHNMVEDDLLNRSEERRPECDYDKFYPSHRSKKPYSASFRTFGKLTVELSPLYEICYCHYDGELDEDRLLPAAVDSIDFDADLGTGPSINNDTEYFDLFSRKIQGPQQGPYIVKSGNKVIKMIGK